VPQSFVEVDQRAYLSATIAVYELNESATNSDLYVCCYRAAAAFDNQRPSRRFDEDSSTLPNQRRALRCYCTREGNADKVAEWITANVPKDVQPHHREKFISTCSRSRESYACGSGDWELRRRSSKSVAEIAPARVLQT